MSSSFLGNAASIAGRRPAFTEAEGLASIAEMDSGFSAKRAFFYTSKRIGRFVSFPSPRPALFYDPRGGEPHHFLDSCYLCKKPLCQNSDIYMYRGDTPFCSEWCRQEQIDMDEASEKKKKNQCHSSSVRLPSSKADPQPRPSSSSSSNSSRSDGFRPRAGTVVAG